jgi:hypothetical protein
VMRIIECPLCTVTEQRLARRSWRERLLSWPWRPWVATEQVSVEVPDLWYYTIGNVAVCHPAVARRVRENLSRLGKGG